MSKAGSSPRPAGAGVINKAMRCVANPVQMGVRGLISGQSWSMISFVCIIVPAMRFFQLADRHLFWVVTSAWHLGVDGGSGA